MPPRNKRKRPVVKTEPRSSSPSGSLEWQGPAKRVKAEPGYSDEGGASDTDMGASSDDIGVEVVVELSDDDRGFLWQGSRQPLSRQTGRPVRRSAGGRAPRRGVDVGRLYEEAGVGQLARSLGQVVKEECGTGVVVCGVKLEEGSGSPLRVSDCVRRAAAVRVEQLLRGGEGNESETTVRSRDGTTEASAPRTGKGKFAPKFNAEQRALLRAQFDADPYPDKATKEGLSESFGVDYKTIQIWFTTERQRRGCDFSDDRDRLRMMCKFGSAVYDDLVAQFELNPRPSLRMRKALALKAGASVNQINGWFEYRRKRHLEPQKKVNLSPAMRAALEEVYEGDPYPDRATRTRLAKKTGCTMTRISTWFHHRRRKAGLAGISKEELARRACQFGPEGYDRLVAHFETDPFPDRETRVALAAELGGTVKQIDNWFSRRRSRVGIANNDNSARQKCALGPAAYDELVAVFETNPFPDRKTREALATKMGGAPKQIKKWFEKRRAREGIRASGEISARNKCSLGPQVYDELVAQFEADPYPDSATQAVLAQEAGGSRKQIKSWFDNRLKASG